MTLYARTQDDFIAPQIDATNSLIHSTQTWNYGGTSSIDPAPLDNGDSHGWIRLNTTSTSGRTSYVALGQVPTGDLVRVDGCRRFKFRLSTNTGLDILIRFGIGTDGSSLLGSTDSIFAEYDSAGFGEIRFVTRASGVSTTTSTGLTSITPDTSYEFVRVSASQWNLYTLTSGIRQLRAVNTTNVPSGSVAMTPGASIANHTASARHMDLDLFEMVSGSGVQR